MKIIPFGSALAIAAAAFIAGARPAAALERQDANFKIFQFPADKIPVIDGKGDDWAIVPDDYIIGSDQTHGDSGLNLGKSPDPKSLDVKIKVGWVKGLNRLYFLYEAYDNYWDFTRPGLQGDIFELAVDGDRSGGSFIDRFHPDGDPSKATDGKTISARDGWFSYQGNQAQNYHIFVPAEGKDWCMAWGPQASWIKKLPYSNVAYSYTVKQGEAGRVTMELWITPFDYAAAEGPGRSVESVLTENKIIGVSWAIMDSDDDRSNAHAFWNLSPKHTMFGKAEELCAFKLMPLEPQFRKAIDADWSFKIINLDRRVVAFQDESIGKITSWKWDFGDGTTSAEQHPVHTYGKPGQFVVVLYIEGPDGKSRRSKVWDVTLR
ncbi:MAG TPA: PKD domain-containing protein [Opitutaceae bacterium]|nr:PKD domain-containing protein [Opitutaceae bacterium]